MNEQKSYDKVTGAGNGISNSHSEIKITTGRTLAHQKIKSSSLNFKVSSSVQKYDISSFLLI